MTGTAPAVAVVPVKAFAVAKQRLATALEPGARAALARRLAEVVVSAAAPLPVLVVCDDDEVATWAASLDAEVVWAPGRGLDGAVADGVARAAGLGADRAVVCHADLPLADDLGRLLALGPGVVLVPDRHGDGTNVAVVPTRSGFRFAYGVGSARRHAAEARRVGAHLHVVGEDPLAWDVDVPADLDHPAVAVLLGRGAAAGCTP